MKYFIKTASWTEMIEAERNFSSPRFQDNEALQKLTSALHTIEDARPLAAGKNPDPTCNYILSDMGLPKIG